MGPGRGAENGVVMERFDHYVERCLYGPAGFYAAAGRAGRAGDFLTSPEVGPLFGAVLVRALRAVWSGAGEPEPFTVYDVGCGPGTLLRSVRVALDGGGERPPWKLVGVDRVDAEGAAIHELPDDLSGSVVVANELLDNLAFRVVERSAGGSLVEVFVDGQVGEGADGWVERALPIDLDGIDPAQVAVLERLPSGARVPLLDQARSWVTDVLGRNPVAVVLFDYGALTTVELARRGGWLRTYRNHQRGHDPLVEPGRWDITTDVAWDQLPVPDGLETQADFLARWGIDDLVDEGRRYWQEHAARPDLGAVRMRSRVIEAEALTDPSGLGGFWAAWWGNLGDTSRLGLNHDHGCHGQE